jgi:hypothetical protein
MIRSLSLTGTALAFALTLAACGSKDDGTPGTEVTLDAKGDAGENVTASLDKSGNAKINVPGFKAEISLPKIKLGAGDFSMDGVKLYPGSTIQSFNITGDGKEDSGTVKVSFDAPGEPKVVLDWFAKKLAEDAGYKLTANGTSLSGTDKDGGPFSLSLEPGIAGHSKGTISTSDAG